MKPVRKPLLAAMGAVVLGATLAATSAGAVVVCNRYHECWHVHDRLTYPDSASITFYDDTWTAPDATYHWLKDRDDRGYYTHGHWRSF